MPTLRALECLVAVADSGSITRAAAALHMSQPAVSHQIAGLEREARTALLRRVRRGVTLTPAGRAAVADARAAIDAAEAAMRSARAVGAAAGGSLRLACAQSLMTVLAPVLRDWRRTQAEVAIVLRESTDAPEMLGFLDADEVDMVFMPATAPPRYTSRVVIEEEIVVVLPNDHRLATRRAVGLCDLHGEDLVHFAPDNGLSAWLDESLAEAGVWLPVSVRTGVTATAPQLAAAGLGVAVCPVSAVGPGFAGIVRPFAPPWLRPLAAVTTGPPDPLLERFVTDLGSRTARVPPKAP